jgi:uncharacterized protein (DUF697 family)
MTQQQFEEAIARVVAVAVCDGLTMNDVMRGLVHAVTEATGVVVNAVESGTTNAN